MLHLLNIYYKTSIYCCILLNFAKLQKSFRKSPLPYSATFSVGTLSFYSVNIFYVKFVILKFWFLIFQLATCSALSDDRDDSVSLCDGKWVWLYILKSSYDWNFFQYFQQLWTFLINLKEFYLNKEYSSSKNSFFVAMIVTDNKLILTILRFELKKIQVKPVGHSTELAG